MISTLLFTASIMIQAEPPASVPATETTVEKQIVYQKSTEVDLSGSSVQGESKLPPAFFVNKIKTPKASSLLEERLKFGLKDYNQTGF